MLEGCVAAVGETNFANQFTIDDQLCGDLNIGSVKGGEFFVPVLAVNLEEEGAQGIGVVEVALWMMQNAIGTHAQSVGRIFRPRLIGSSWATWATWTTAHATSPTSSTAPFSSGAIRQGRASSFAFIAVKPAIFVNVELFVQKNVLEPGAIGWSLGEGD